MTRLELIEAELAKFAEEIGVRPTLLAAYFIDVYSQSVSNGYVRGQDVSTH